MGTADFSLTASGQSQPIIISIIIIIIVMNDTWCFEALMHIQFASLSTGHHPNQVHKTWLPQLGSGINAYASILSSRLPLVCTIHMLTSWMDTSKYEQEKQKLKVTHERINVAKCNLGKVKIEPILVAGCVFWGLWIIP